jgi:hypothetical protein
MHTYKDTYMNAQYKHMNDEMFTTLITISVQNVTSKDKTEGDGQMQRARATPDVTRNGKTE